MLLSIIVPVYNIHSYLNQCVDSLLCEREDYEIILVDDGSTDGSRDVCMKYAEQFPQVKTYSKTNGGVSSARNYGLSKAKGKYVYFVDGDDFVDGLTCLLSKLTEIDSDVFLLNYSVLGKNDVPIKQHIYTHSCLPVRELAKYKERHSHAPWEYVFKRERLKKYGILFSTDLKYAEDWVLVTQYIATAVEVKCVTGFTYFYRKSREGSAMNQTYDQKQVLLHLAAFDMINSIEPNNESHNYIQSEKKECFSYVLNIIRQNIDKMEGCNVQSMIRKRINLSLLRGSNLKFMVKVTLAYINIKFL